VKVPFYRHDLGRADAERVAAVLESPILTSGDVGKRVEAQLAAYFGLPHAALVSSWTNGAVAALLALDVGAGDEVIVPAMTFIATSNVVEHVGAKPVFVDVDPATLLMTPEAVARALSPRTKAVIPVHLYGLLCDMKGIEDVLRGRPDVAVIEDAAHAFEARRDGERPGARSTMAIFSFYATKNVTCGEGGAIVCRDPALHVKLTETRLHGMSAGAADRFKGGLYRHWDMTRLGVKANLPDLLAALLPPQIETIDARLPRRETLARRYEDAFRGTALRLVAGAKGALHARHLFAIGVPAPVRDRALALLGEHGVGATVNYRSVPTLTWYRERYGFTPADHPVSHAWGESTITLPLFPSMTDAEQAHVIEVVRAHVLPLAGRPVSG
jgi:dTDP-4-amino-4,6-dideoxygalactose transaminase